MATSEDTAPRDKFGLTERNRIGLDAANEIQALTQLLLHADKGEFFEWAARGVTIRIGELAGIMHASITDTNEPIGDLRKQLAGTIKDPGYVV